MFASSPLIVRHHFLIDAVPVAAGVAVALKETFPATVVLFVEVQTTEGLVFAVVNVSVAAVDSRSLESVTLTTRVYALFSHLVVS